jgi:hypothetical protein
MPDGHDHAGCDDAETTVNSGEVCLDLIVESLVAVLRERRHTRSDHRGH